MKPAHPRQLANPFHRFENGEGSGLFASSGGLFIQNSKDMRNIARHGGEMCWPYAQGIVTVFGYIGHVARRCYIALL